MKNILVVLIFFALFQTSTQASEWKGTIWCDKEGQDTCEATCKRWLCTTGGHGEFNGNTRRVTKTGDVIMSILQGVAAFSGRYAGEAKQIGDKDQCECRIKY